MLPLFSGRGAMGYIRFDQTRGFRWLILPIPERMYTFYVGQKPVEVQVPWDFSLEDIVLKTFYPDLESFEQILEQAQKLKQIALVNGIPMIKTGININQGQTLLNFDILSGDMLFVDRMSYNFVHPKIGNPFVFRTVNIEGMRHPDGTPEDKYFIKRLVGIGGDTLEIKPPLLYRNGAPITGAAAFDYNAQKVDKYPGYTTRFLADPDAKIKIPDGFLYGMGDNSPYSADSRAWGLIPEKEVIGRALFIFYPFTKRWGFAH